MDKRSIFGKLCEKPFSFLLFDLWNLRKNGTLFIKTAETEKILFFEEGNLAVTATNFNERNFFSHLTEKEIIDASSLETLFTEAEQQSMSLIKTSIHLKILPSSILWKWIQKYAVSDILPFFDRDDAEFVFQPDRRPDTLKTLCRMQTLAVILQGTRQMENSDFIASKLPEKDGDVQVLFPQHQSQVPFLPHEEYLLHLLSNLQNLDSVYSHAEISKKDIQQVIFTFLSLGLLTFSRTERKKHVLPDISQAELNTILSTFNKKWLFIFKYISKELGPVAQNILEKTLEDAKARLSPLFQSVKLQPDGNIDTNSVLKAKFNFSSQGTKQNLLLGLNEIIVSEVMAVKKTLGDEHEAILIQNLQKIGK